MPRELWAKIAVEIIRDPKLLSRQPWERWLWIGLICIAKEMAEDDGILRGYDAKALASILHLGVPHTKVEQAIEHFIAVGMVRRLDDGGLELVNFKKRQAPSLGALRQEKWRDKRRNAGRNGHGDASGDGGSNADETGGNGVGTTEVDETRGEEKRLDNPHSPPARGADSSGSRSRRRNSPTPDLRPQWEKQGFASEAAHLEHVRNLPDEKEGTG